MAKNINKGSGFGGLFGFDESNGLPKPQNEVSKAPETAAEVIPDKSVEPEETKPTSENKSNRTKKNKPIEQSEGRKTVTVYLNADNWAKFCLIANVRKPSASVWLDELIAEEVQKNKDVLKMIEQFK